MADLADRPADLVGRAREWGVLERAVAQARRGARQAVRARIRYAIDRISSHHPALGRHLEASIRTGLFCSYRPERPVTWEVKLRLASLTS